MAGGPPVLTPKRSAIGSKERLRLLQRAGVCLPERPAGAAVDDLLDACALTWSARRVADGTASHVPDPPSRDARGLRMELHW
jgi:predicted RNase H-like nuclease